MTTVKAYAWGGTSDGMYITYRLYRLWRWTNVKGESHSNQHKSVRAVPRVVTRMATNSSQVDFMTFYCAVHTRSRYTYELRSIGASNHVTRALTGTTNYLNIHSRYLHQECGVLARGEGVYGTCDDSRSRKHTHYQQCNRHCTTAEQYEAVAL